MPECGVILECRSDGTYPYLLHFDGWKSAHFAPQPLCSFSCKMFALIPCRFLTHTTWFLGYISIKVRSVISTIFMSVLYSLLKYPNCYLWMAHQVDTPQTPPLLLLGLYWFTAFSLPGQFAPRSESANRTLANSLPGTFAPWPIRSLALSLPGTFAARPFHSLAFSLLD